MKKLLSTLLIALSCATVHAESTKTIYNPFTGKPDYITSVNGQNFQSGSGVTVTCTNGVCTFTGGGGGASSLQVTSNGVQITSPTPSMNFGTQFTLAAVGSTPTIALNNNLIVSTITASSITINGFFNSTGNSTIGNGAAQVFIPNLGPGSDSFGRFVQVSSITAGNPLMLGPIYAKDIPAGSGNYIQNTSSLQSSATFYVSSGTVNGQLTVSGPIVGNGAYLTNVPIMSPSSTAPFPGPTPGTIDITDTYNTQNFSTGKGGYKIGGTPTLSRNGSAIYLGSSNGGGASGTICEGDSSCGHIDVGATNNIAIGGGALAADVSGASNICIGNNSCASLTSTQNTCTGAGSCASMVGANENAAYGYIAGQNITSGTNNTCVGYDACDLLNSGIGNAIFGDTSGADITTGSRNTCLGGDTNAIQPCQGIISGSSNTAVGNGAGGNISYNGNEFGNTDIGYNAAHGIGVNKSVCIGFNCVNSSSFTATIGHVGTSDALLVVASTITVSSMSVTSLTSGGCVQAGPGGTLTTPSGSACGSGGGGGSPSGTINNASQFSAAYYSVTGSSNAISGSSISMYSSSMTVGSLTSTSLGNNPYSIFSASGTSQAMQINVNGTPSGGAQNMIGGVTINGPTDSGGSNSPALLVLQDSATNTTNGAGLLELWEQNPNHNSYLMWIHGASPRNSDEPIRFDGPTFGIDEVSLSTDTGGTHGMGKWKVISEAFGSVDLQVASPRAYDNTTFENLAYYHPLQKSDLEPGLYLNPQNLTNDSAVLSSSDTSGINFFSLNAHTVGLTAPQNPSASYIFGLPDTVGSAGQIWYNSGNRGGNFNVRQLKQTGSDLLYSPSTGVTISTLTLNSTALASQNCLGTDSSGKVQAGTCTGGGGGAGGTINVSTFGTVGYYSGVGTTTISGLSPGTSGQVLLTGGLSSTPFWGQPVSTITAAGLGALTANQSITWTGSGDVTGTSSDPTSLTPTLTAAALQNNITTFGSSVTVTNANGINVKYGISAASATFSTGVTASSITFLNQGNTRVVYMNGTNLGTSSTYTWNGTTMSATDVAGTGNLNAFGGTNFTGNVNLSSGVLLSGASGSNGQVLTSGGANTVPTWTTVSGGGGGIGGTINAANQFLAPYYSLAGSSTVLSGFTNMTLSTNTINAVSITTNTVIASSNSSNAFAVTATGGNYGTNTPNGAGAEIDCTNTGTQGNCFQIYSHQGTQNQLDAGLSVVMDSNTYNERAIYVQQNGTANSPVNGYRQDAYDYSTMTLEDTKRNANGINGIYQFSDHNDCFRMESRISGSFENAFQICHDSGSVNAAINSDYGVAASTFEVAGNVSIGSEGTPSPINGLRVQGNSLFASSMTVLGASGQTVKYNLTAGSITVSGSGAGQIALTQGADSAIVPTSSVDTLWASTSSGTLVYIKGTVASTYTVVGSSTVPTNGHLAAWSSQGTLIDGGTGGGGSVTSVTATNGVISTGGTTPNISVSSVSLSTQVVGNLPVANLNSGTNADSSHFWRGDGTWVSSSTFGGSSAASWPSGLVYFPGMGGSYPSNVTSYSSYISSTIYCTDVYDAYDITISSIGAIAGNVSSLRQAFSILDGVTGSVLLSVNATETGSLDWVRTTFAPVTVTHGYHSYCTAWQSTGSSYDVYSYLGNVLNPSVGLSGAGTHNYTCNTSVTGSGSTFAVPSNGNCAASGSRSAVNMGSGTEAQVLWLVNP